MNASTRPHSVRHVQVLKDRDGQRLDNFLLGLLDGVPRSLVYRLVRTGQVRVNGGRAKPMQKLRCGDEVRVPPVASRPPSDAVLPAQLVGGIKQRIVGQNESYCVVDKPAGLAMHAGSGLRYGLVDVMSRLNPAWRPVHRLDRATSGLVVFAATRAALAELQRCFTQRKVSKRYLALLSGELREDRVEVDAALKKIRDNSGQHRVIADPDGQSALTRFRVLERVGGYSYVEAEIETGRTHQIRAHARHIDHPIAGDERYNPEAPPTDLRRLFLHAHSLRLPWPDDQVFSVPLPQELATALEKLRRSDP